MRQRFTFVFDADDTLTAPQAAALARGLRAAAEAEGFKVRKNTVTVLDAVIMQQPPRSRGRGLLGALAASYLPPAARRRENTGGSGRSPTGTNKNDY